MPFTLPPPGTKYRGMFFADKHSKIQVLRGFRTSLAEITQAVEVVFLEAFLYADTKTQNLTGWSVAQIDGYLQTRKFDHHPEMAEEYRQILGIIGGSGILCVGVDNAGGGFFRGAKKWNDDNWIKNIKEYLLANGKTTFALFGGSSHANGLKTPMAMSFQGYQWNSLGKLWMPFAMGPVTDILYGIASGPARNRARRLECCDCLAAKAPATHGVMPGIVNLWHICNRCESVYCPQHGGALAGKRNMLDPTRDCRHCLSRTTTISW